MFKHLAVGAALSVILAALAESGQLAADLRATLQEHPSVVGVRVDFDALLAAAGLEMPFDPASVEVRAADGTLLAVRVSEEDGLHRVSWEAPAADSREKVGAEAVFEMRFGGEPGASPALGKAESLIFNGDFSLLNEDGVPLGATAWVRRHYASGNLRGAEGSQGGNAVTFNFDAEEGRAFSLSTPWVRINGGESYEYRVRYRAEGGRPERYNLVAHAWANFQDAEGNRLPRTAVMSTREGESGGWREKRMAIDAPEGAATTNIIFHAFSGEPWSVFLDEVGVVPVRPGEVLAARLVEGGTASIRGTSQHIFRFDMGTASSPAMDGFLPVHPGTEYDAETGYGFTRLGRPRAVDGGFADDLGRDLLAAARADFRLDLPNGDYRVWMLTGDPQTGATVVRYYFDKSLTVNRQEAYRNDTSPAEFFRTEHFRNSRHFWVPGMDYYDTFVVPRYREHHCDVRVANGRMAFSWRNLPVCGMIVYPVEAADAMEAEIAYLRGRRRRDTAVNIVPGPEEEAVQPTPEEEQRGFMLFRRPANEEVFPSSRPQEGERAERLSAFGVPGQTVAVHFSLYPMRDLGEVGVRLGGLRDGRNTIPADACEVRVVRYMFRRVQRGEEGRLRVSPFLLDRRESVPADGGTTWSWYALVDIPDDAAEGAYRGSAEIVSAENGGVLGRVPVEIQVLPFDLAPLPIVQGYYYFPSEPWYSTFWGANVVGPRYRDDPEIMAIIEENERRDMRFMKSLGLNSISFGDDMRGDLRMEDGEVKFTEDNRFVWWMDIYAEEGMGPMPFYGFQAFGTGTGAANRIMWLDRDNPELADQFTDAWNRAYKSLVREGMRHQAERGWPEILWYTSDERSNYREEGAKQGVELVKLLRQVPEARSIASMNGPWEHVMVPHLDISMPNIAFPITDETIAMIHEAGSELWLYNCGSQRMTLGLYPWRVQAGGRFQWHYRQMGGQQWDDGTGRGSTQYSIALTTPDEVVPALAAQIQRESIYDHRYVVTLENAIESAKGRLVDGGGQALRQRMEKAEEFVGYLRSRVPVDVREVIGFRIDPRAAEAAIGGEFRNTDNLDRVRWAAAQLIMELEGH